MPVSPIVPKEKIQRSADSTLKIIIVGAGLGGLGAAIALLLAGHDVDVFEAASEISEVGAGIQILPNSSRVLQTWGMLDELNKYATKPSRVNMRHWKGEIISSLDFAASAAQYPGTFYWDFHRANLHKCLLQRAVELGARTIVNARVSDVQVSADGETATIVLQNGEKHTADLVVGADGINSRLREIMLGKTDPPELTGDLAYRLLLSTKEMLKDPELATFVTNPQVNYWMGPDAHAEMRALYKDWDPRIPKLLSLCESVSKWRLCIRTGMENWSHPSGAFTMLGDAVHATLPYLASGAGMSLEDGAILGEIFSRHSAPFSAQKKIQLLDIYQKIRGPRTEIVVERGNKQQYLYHLHDGPEQEERDAVMRAEGPGDALAWKDSSFAPWLLGWVCEDEVDRYLPPVETATKNENVARSRL
ncbi:FAD-dependent monooxygenase [Lachnellula willkommii]|uniref:FAD-dependent monooxygenase n=1 Tax=Lachnellula willkommii TaxID=215461 RepID=A0A559MMX1_9HELO|nr:FAD-dependent monooxygenase [Lachnellula willkommii]